MVQDTDDAETHLTSKHISFYQGLSLAELEEKFKILVRASKPVFSGSIDHRVNLLDIVKVQQQLSKKRKDYQPEELALMLKLIELDK